MADNPQRSDSCGSFFAGMLVGIVIGGTLSLLYAPKPGKELRDDIGRKLDEMKDYVDETARQVATVAKERIAEMQSDMATAIDAARAAAAEHAAELSRRAEI